MIRLPINGMPDALKLISNYLPKNARHSQNPMFERRDLLLLTQQTELDDYSDVCYGLLRDSILDDEPPRRKFWTLLFYLGKRLISTAIDYGIGLALKVMPQVIAELWRHFKTLFETQPQLENFHLDYELYECFGTIFYFND